MKDGNYNNEYLGVSVKAVENWKLFSHQTSTITKNWSAVYQMADNQMPQMLGIPKILFSFIKTPIEKLSYHEIDLELSIIKLTTIEHIIGTNTLESSGKIFHVKEINEKECKLLLFYAPFRDDYFFHCRITIFEPCRESEIMNIFRSIVFVK